jgi:hypothetical protein
MLAFLKSNPRPRASDERLRDIEKRIGEDFSFCLSRTVVPARPDTQAALSVLLGIPRAVRPPLGFAGDDLVGVRLDRADLSGANLRDASLAGAKLANARFQGAHFPTGTDLRGACLRGARFDGAKISGIKATGADFSGADLATARNLKRNELKDAITDECTRLPWKREVPLRCTGREDKAPERAKRGRRSNSYAARLR